MHRPSQPEQELEQRLAVPSLDVLIRAGLLLAMALLCYRVLSPFLTLMVWALTWPSRSIRSTKPSPASSGVSKD
jgi:hypothetical protein